MITLLTCMSTKPPTMACGMCRLILRTERLNRGLEYARISIHVLQVFRKRIAQYDVVNLLPYDSMGRSRSLSIFKHNEYVGVADSPLQMAALELYFEHDQVFGVDGNQLGATGPVQHIDHAPITATAPVGKQPLMASLKATIEASSRRMGRRNPRSYCWACCSWWSKCSFNSGSIMLVLMNKTDTNYDLGAGQVDCSYKGLVIKPNSAHR